MWRGGAHVVVSIVDRVEHLHELSGCPAAAMEVQDLRDDLSCANYVARWPRCELALHSIRFQAQCPGFVALNGGERVPCRLGLLCAHAYP